MIPYTGTNIRPLRGRVQMQPIQDDNRRDIVTIHRTLHEFVLMVWNNRPQIVMIYNASLLMERSCLRDKKIRAQTAPISAQSISVCVSHT